MTRRIGRRTARGGGGVQTFASRIRALGAIAHFDPSSGATDDGTTSTWVDRIGGYSVASTSQATRMTYTTASASLNNRPGFVGVSASATKLQGAASLAALMSGAINLTVYTVHALSSNAAQSATWCIGTVANTAAYMGLVNATTSGGTNVHRNSAVGTGRILNTTNPAVTSIVTTPTAASWWTNGGPSGAAANASAPSCDLFTVGALRLSGAHLQHMSGVVGDIIVFSGAHSDATRMHVERLIAAKYGWTVLQGLSGFSAANYLSNAGLTSGIRGDNTNGIWSDVLLRADLLPSIATQNIAGAYAPNTGHGFISSTAAVAPTAYNGTTSAVGPGYTQLAADVGKLQIWGIAAGPANLVRTFRQGAEVGAGTALTGFSANSDIAYSVGARDGANPASQYSIFGVAGGDAAQVAANAADRAAAIKAANSFVTTGGVAATHGWALSSVNSTYSDLVGSDALTLSGTLTAAQIIIPTWPW